MLKWTTAICWWPRAVEQLNELAFFFYGPVYQPLDMKALAEANTLSTFVHVVVVCQLCKGPVQICFADFFFFLQTWVTLIGSVLLVMRTLWSAVRCVHSLGLGAALTSLS